MRSRLSLGASGATKKSPPKKHGKPSFVSSLRGLIQGVLKTLNSVDSGKEKFLLRLRNGSGNIEKTGKDILDRTELLGAQPEKDEKTLNAAPSSGLTSAEARASEKKESVEEPWSPPAQRKAGSESGGESSSSDSEKGNTLDSGSLLRKIFERLDQAKKDEKKDLNFLSKAAETFVYRRIFRGLNWEPKQVPAHQSGEKLEEKLVLKPGWQVITPSCSEEMKNVAADQLKVEAPRLAHGLDHVLRRTGVVPTRHPSKPQLNLPAHLKKVPKVHKVRRPYMKPSQDKLLASMATKADEQVHFRMSTSSCTKSLSLLYHLVSNYKPVNVKGLGKEFQDKARNFARYSYVPVSLIMHPPDKESGSRAVDPGPSYASDNVLMQLGLDLEEFLTKELNSDKVGKEIDEPEQDLQFYSFNQIGGTLVRAQIDCRSNNCRAETCRTTKFLEIKTRAVAPIRYDVKGYEKHLTYKIDRLHGEKHSFELEFFDMIRTVFLRYSLQIRLGQMRGAFICFHNTRQIFGFEYLPLAEMDSYIFGNSYWAHLSFMTCMKLYEAILKSARSAFPEDDGSSLRITMSLLEERTGMCIFVHRYYHGRDPLAASRLGSHLVANSGKASSRLVDPRDVSMFYLNVHPYVNGNRIRRPINVKMTDSYQLAYKLERATSVDLKLFMESYIYSVELKEFTSDMLPSLATKFEAAAMRKHAAKRKSKEKEQSAEKSLSNGNGGGPVSKPKSVPCR